MRLLNKFSCHFPKSVAGDTVLDCKEPDLICFSISSIIFSDVAGGSYIIL